jgi:hypothetical protein
MALKALAPKIPRIKNPLLLFLASPALNLIYKMIESFEKFYNLPNNALLFVRNRPIGDE